MPFNNEVIKSTTRGHNLCPRIIAGFIGVGKTTYCEQNRRAVDLGVMPFKYPFDYERLVLEKRIEAMKGSPDLEMNWNWRYTYYDALSEVYEKYPGNVIVIPTDGTILHWLDRDHMPFYLIYPYCEARLEYRERLEKRGNGCELQHIFADENSWERWMQELRRPYTYAVRRELNEGQYLSDVMQHSLFAFTEMGKMIENPSEYILRKSAELNRKIKTVQDKKNMEYVSRIKELFEDIQRSGEYGLLNRIIVSCISYENNDNEEKITKNKIILNAMVDAIEEIEDISPKFERYKNLIIEYLNSIYRYL